MRGCSETFVEQEILKAQNVPINELLEKESSHQKENKLTFNVTYYPAFQIIKKTSGRITDSTSTR